MKGWAAALLVVFASTGPVAAGGPLYPRFDLNGFDYEDPDPDPSVFGEVGSAGEVGGFFDWSTPIPNGFVHSVTGQARFGGGLPAQPSTWGRIKAAYR